MVITSAAVKNAMAVAPKTSGIYHLPSLAISRPYSRLNLLFSFFILTPFVSKFDSSVIPKVSKKD